MRTAILTSTWLAGVVGAVVACAPVDTSVGSNAAGHASTTNGSATGASGGAAGSPSNRQDCASLVGSYNLSLTQTTVAKPAVPITVSLTNDESGCRAIASLEYYPDVSVAVSVSPTAVVLDDSKGPNRPVLTYGTYPGIFWFDEFHLDQLSLFRDSTGAFTGTVSADGTQRYFQDDIGDTSLVTYAGTLVRDVAGPVLRGGPQTVLAPSRGPAESRDKPNGGLARRGLPPDQLLPWDDVHVQASEPTPGLASHLSLPANVAGAFVDATIESGVTAKNVWATTRFLDWDQVRGTTQTIHIDPGLSDHVGNAVTQSELPIKILDVGPVVESHEFNDAAALGTFGDVTFLDGMATITAPCGAGVGGIAGRIQTSGKSKLIIIATATSNSMLVRATGKSGRALTANISLSNTADGEDRYEFTLDGESEVGFSVVPNSLCHWTTHATGKVDRVYAE